ncbi:MULTISPECIES: hypothetical protein [unclassified Bradyrhizobium]|uniref:hypothetical protein n=1 Tax=unclassified Bradyrhizobium TaxID=2631580 RepID=UPI001FFE426D|nr:MULTISPECIES: hypothetical protein [unclassified Bradyrhizobium]
MDQHQVWHEPAFDKAANAISPFLLRSGIYLFLISFICLFYVLNAPLLLGHYDLGWHLAAGISSGSATPSRSTTPGRSPTATSHGSICPGSGTRLPVRRFNTQALAASSC